MQTCITVSLLISNSADNRIYSANFDAALEFTRKRHRIPGAFFLLINQNVYALFLMPDCFYYAQILQHLPLQDVHL